jgi:hypothetical protein
MTPEETTSPYTAVGAAAAETAAMNGTARAQPAGEDLASKVLRDTTLTLRAVEEIDTRLAAVQIELAVCIGLCLLLVALAGAQIKASMK